MSDTCTSEDLHALLPAEPNGAPTGDGFFVTQLRTFKRGEPSVVEVCGGSIFWGGDCVDPANVVSHAPLRLHTAEDADRLEQAQRIAAERGLALTLRCAELDAAMRRATVAEDDTDPIERAGADQKALGLARNRADRAELALAAQTDRADKAEAAIISEGQTRASCAALREALLGLRDLRATLPAEPNKAPRPTWFSDCGEDGTAYHATEAEARGRVEKALERREEIAAEDGWSEDIEDLCWGEIRGRVVETSREETPGGEFDYRATYGLREVGSARRLFTAEDAEELAVAEGRAGLAELRAVEAEAACAAMRGALDAITSAWGACGSGQDVYVAGVRDEAPVRVQDLTDALNVCGSALVIDAGRDLLVELESLRAQVAALGARRYVGCDCGRGWVSRRHGTIPCPPDRAPGDAPCPPDCACGGRGFVACSKCGGSGAVLVTL